MGDRHSIASQMVAAVCSEPYRSGVMDTAISLLPSGVNDTDHRFHGVTASQNAYWVWSTSVRSTSKLLPMSGARHHDHRRYWHRSAALAQNSSASTTASFASRGRRWGSPPTSAAALTST